MKYRKKPVVVEAIQLTTQNIFKIEWEFPSISFYSVGNRFFIKTLEGDMNVKDGDWIVKM